MVVDREAFAFDGEDHAGFDGLAVEEHGTGAAVAVFTAAFGTGEPDLFAQHAQEGVAGADAGAPFFAVDAEVQLGGSGNLFHASSSSEARIMFCSRATRYSAEARESARSGPKASRTAGRAAPPSRESAASAASERTG